MHKELTPDKNTPEVIAMHIELKPDKNTLEVIALEVPSL